MNTSRQLNARLRLSAVAVATVWLLEGGTARAELADGFVYPVLGASQTDPTSNVVNPLTDGWTGNSVGWSEGGDSAYQGHLGQDYIFAGDPNQLACSATNRPRGDASWGKAVYAVANGVVVSVMDANTDSGWPDNRYHGWGRAIVIRHVVPGGTRINTIASMPTTDPNQANPSLVYSSYGHLQAVSVAVDQEVSKGDAIGTIGWDGVNCSHLHFELKNQTAVDAPEELCCAGGEYPVAGLGFGYSRVPGFTPNRYRPEILVRHNTMIRDDLPALSVELFKNGTLCVDGCRFAPHDAIRLDLIGGGLFGIRGDLVIVLTRFDGGAELLGYVSNVTVPATRRTLIDSFFDDTMLPPAGLYTISAFVYRFGETNPIDQANWASTLDSATFELSW